MKSFYLTDAGKVRDHNEDSVVIVEGKDTQLMAIADGMGGHRAGEVASSIAINYLATHFKETFINMSKVDAVKWIRAAFEEINNLIFQHEKNNPESKGMGTTLVMALFFKDNIFKCDVFAGNDKYSGNACSIDNMSISIYNQIINIQVYPAFIEIFFIILKTNILI